MGRRPLLMLVVPGLLVPVVACDVQPSRRRNAGTGIAGVGLDPAMEEMSGSTTASTTPTTTTATTPAAPSANGDGPPPPSRAPVPEPPPPEPERVVAEAGVGVKGRTLTGKGYLQTVFRTKFQTEQRLEFMKIEHALNLFEGMHGRKPESHEEFMKEIVKFNQIQLPRLPEGEKYVYDPADGELYVERPGTAPQ
jgi:hypothetical protein